MALAKKDETIEIMEVQREEVHFCILGTSPLIMNRMSEKAKRELLLPKGKKTAADKAANAKHDPIQEFRDSPYTLKDDAALTFLAVLPTAFKGAMGSAALDMPGAKRAQIERLVVVPWDKQPVFGIPKLFMSVTRSADMNKTPDIRTRAILPEWACRLSLSFNSLILKRESIVNLLAAAGMQSGVGDWRQEKGSGNYGSFCIVAEDDPRWQQIVKTGGRKAQLKAMQEADPYDDESAEMLNWYSAEVKRRGFKVAA